MVIPNLRKIVLSTSLECVHLAGSSPVMNHLNSCRLWDSSLDLAVNLLSLTFPYWRTVMALSFQKISSKAGSLCTVSLRGADLTAQWETLNCVDLLTFFGALVDYRGRNK